MNDNLNQIQIDFILTSKMIEDLLYHVRIHNEMSPAEVDKCISHIRQWRTKLSELEKLLVC